MRKLKDNVPQEIKQRRLTEIIDKQMEHSLIKNRDDKGISD